MNTKRGRGLKKIKLKPIDLSKNNLKNIEKIILKRLKPKDFTVTFTRRNVLLQEIEEVISSARYYQDKGLTYKHIEIASKSPNVWVVLTKKETIINAQRQYDKGENLAMIEETIQELTKYINSIS